MRPIRFALVFAALALMFGVGTAAVYAQEVGQSADASASPNPAPSIPPPKPGPDDPRRHKFAVQQFLAWQQGTVDRTLYSDEVNSELSDDVLDRGTRTLANMGGMQSAVYLGISHTKAGDVYVYKITCEHGSVNMDFALAPDGKISLIFFE